MIVLRLDPLDQLFSRLLPHALAAGHQQPAEAVVGEAGEIGRDRALFVPRVYPTRSFDPGSHPRSRCVAADAPHPSRLVHLAGPKKRAVPPESGCR